MMVQRDTYWKLRPPEPTPPDEMCSCRDKPAIKLMCALTYNPIHCVRCNGEVAPEAIDLPEELAEGIAHWRGIFDALDRLWLDSGAYAEWAKNELAGLTSAVNLEGRCLQEQLNGLRRCYYWWFQDESVADYAPPTACPICAGLLEEYEGTEQQVCRRCSLITVRYDTHDPI